MRTTFPTVVMALAAASLLACNVTEADQAKYAADTSTQAVSTFADSWVVVTRDTRTCLSPLCGGFWVIDVNRMTTKPVYVSSIDFTPAELDEKTIDLALAAGPFELLLNGRLGPIDSSYDTRPFVAKRVLRGLPGARINSFDTFYAVQLEHLECFAAPCAIGHVDALNRTNAWMQIHRTDVSEAAPPFVDQLWLRDQMEMHGALVAGYLDSGDYYPAGFEVVLRATQVFMPLPYRQAACLHLASLDCERFERAVSYRDADRCVTPLACVRKHGCASTMIPTCWAGYTRQSWVGADGCTATVCDPTFTLR